MIKRQSWLCVALVMVGLAISRMALAQDGMGSRHPVLPGGSLLKHNVSAKSELVIGVDYLYEYLNVPLYGTESIPNINRDRTNNTVVAMYARYGFSDRFSLTAVFPYRRVTNEKVLFRGQNPDQYEGGRYVRHTSGLGDIIFMLNYLLPMPAWAPQMVLSGGVKLANGDIDAKDKYGTRITDILQIGSGSVDPVLRFTLAQDVRALVLSAGILTRISSRANVYGYKFGNELQSFLALDYPTGDPFYGGLRLSYLQTSRDHYQYGDITQKRGGSWVYLAPRVGIFLLDNLAFDISIPVAVYQNVNESQLTAPFQIEITASYRFRVGKE